MTMRDWIATILEYLIALLFIRGGIVVLFMQEDGPQYLPGIFTYLVGDFAVVLYGLGFLVTGLLLLYSKWFKKIKIHKWILFAMFMTCMYIGPLAIAVNGLEWTQLQVLFSGFVSAWLYLRWKLKTEYLTEDEAEAFEYLRGR